MTKNWRKKFTAEKKIIFFSSKTIIYLSLGLHKGRPGYKKKPSALKRENSALQNMKFLNFFYFCGSFFPSWIRIGIPNTDPDPLTWLNPDPIRIRIRNPTYNPSIITSELSYLWTSCFIQELYNICTKLLALGACTVNRKQSIPNHLGQFPHLMPYQLIPQAQLRGVKTSPGSTKNYFLFFVPKRTSEIIFFLSPVERTRIQQNRQKWKPKSIGILEKPITTVVPLIFIERCFQAERKINFLLASLKQSPRILIRHPVRYYTNDIFRSCTDNNHQRSCP